MLPTCVVLLAACGEPTRAPQVPAGLDRVVVDALVADVHLGAFGDVRSLLLACGDAPPVEYVFRGTAPDEIAPLYSITKSVTALLTGIAIDRGALASDSVRIATLFPSHAGAFAADTLRARLTVRDLLTMRTGLAWNEFVPPYESPANPFSMVLASPDWLATLLAWPMAHAPGAQYVYNSGGSVLLGASLAAATGTSIPQYAQRQLFDPIGIGSARWHVGPQGVTNTGGGLSLRPRDLIPIGRLVRDGGRLGASTVVSSAWISRMLSPASSAPLGSRYGHQWWLLGPTGPYDAAHPIAVALGWGGQLLAIDRVTDVILVMVSRNFDRDALAFAQSVMRRMPSLAAPGTGRSAVCAAGSGSAR
ncbi:MAG: beta-lactamase family protein [Gemmatimonadetes bacterium]|nr:beta-lactamase family protein [Gemmatimonadota bacterium]